MPNEFGLKCPACGNTDSINVELKVWHVLDEDVSEPYECPLFQGYQCEDEDRANCPQCGHTGTVKTFGKD